MGCKTGICILAVRRSVRMHSTEHHLSALSICTLCPNVIPGEEMGLGQELMANSGVGGMGKRKKRKRKHEMERLKL
jgi:hypothetical protein